MFFPHSRSHSLPTHLSHTPSSLFIHHNQTMPPSPHATHLTKLETVPSPTVSYRSTNKPTFLRPFPRYLFLLILFLLLVHWLHLCPWSLTTWILLHHNMPCKPDRRTSSSPRSFPRVLSTIRCPRLFLPPLASMTSNLPHTRQLQSTLLGMKLWTLNLMPYFATTLGLSFPPPST
jgi:hypothetical protein